MQTVNVISTSNLTSEQLERVRAVSPRLQISQYDVRGGDEVPPDAWSTVEVIYAYNALPEPDQAPRLRWVQGTTAGVDPVLDNPMFRDQVMLTNTSGIHAVSVSEQALTLLLGLSQRLPAFARDQRRAEWHQKTHLVSALPELRGATIGIVGYGSVGREIGRLASAFGMRVLALKRTDERVDHGYIIPGVGDPEGVIPERYYNPNELRGMLSECDYVVLAVPLTKVTRHMIGFDELKAMKPSAYLVNIARGGVVNEPVLIQALRERWIGGAGLDVFSEEPLPADSPLWGLENAILTPHIAGSSPYYNDRALDVFAKNLRRYLAGEALLNQIDIELGY